jgi:hypothetical protein
MTPVQACPEHPLPSQAVILLQRIPAQTGIHRTMHTLMNRMHD